MKGQTTFKEDFWRNLDGFARLLAGIVACVITIFLWIGPVIVALQFEWWWLWTLATLWLVFFGVAFWTYKERQVGR